MHAVAASLILLLEAAQQEDSVAMDLIRTVRDTVAILQEQLDLSMIAKKGFLVLSPLVEIHSTHLGREGADDLNNKDNSAFTGRAEFELQRALDVFRRRHRNLVPPESGVVLGDLDLQGCVTGAEWDDILVDSQPGLMAEDDSIAHDLEHQPTSFLGISQQEWWLFDAPDLINHNPLNEPAL